MIHLEARPRYLQMAMLVVAAVVLAGSGANAKLSVTTYSYNRDGALTAVTNCSDGQAPTKKYITWDNFRPEAGRPASGAVVAADGRIMGFGPAPGAGSLTARFSFDARDRLLGYSGEAGEETYDYHAGGMLLSSSLADDMRYFYQDAGANPAVTNIYHSGSDLWSAYLANSRFVNDGSTKVLLKPRKDVAANYDPDSRTIESYVFDAFGSREDGEGAAGSFDPHDNPLGYAGEYRDPVWGGIYLRARWYHPDLPVFLSRDPMPHLNRYAYGGGNPMMNTDPGGYSASFWKEAEGFLRSADKMLNRGVGGHFARIFLAPLLGPLQIAAYPRQFWETVKTNKSGTDLFLAFGVVSELVGGYIDAAVAGYGARLSKRFAFRMVSDFAIGTSAAIAAANQRGLNHFDWNVFGQGMEYTASPIVLRGLTGFNVRSGLRLTADNVAGMAEELRNASVETALVFRRTGPIFRGIDHTIDTPFLEAAQLGLYHDGLIAVTKRQIFSNDVGERGLRLDETQIMSLDEIKDELKQLKGKFEFVGRLGQFYLRPEEGGYVDFLSNPLNFKIARNNTNVSDLFIRTRRQNREPTKLNPLTNNCQHHARAVLQNIGLR